MSKYCLFLIVIYYLTGGNNSMSRFFKFGKLHVTKGNGDKLLDILLTASKKLKRSLEPTGNLYRYGVQITTKRSGPRVGKCPKWDICQLVWLTKNTSYENVGGIFLRKNTIDS